MFRCCRRTDPLLKIMQCHPGTTLPSFISKEKHLQDMMCSCQVSILPEPSVGVIHHLVAPGFEVLGWEGLHESSQWSNENVSVQLRSECWNTSIRETHSFDHFRRPGASRSSYAIIHPCTDAFVGATR